MTITYGEVGISYAAVTFSYDGTEQNVGLFAPVDVFTIRATYKPSATVPASYKPATQETGKVRPLTYQVTYVPDYAKIGTP